MSYKNEKDLRTAGIPVETWSAIALHEEIGSGSFARVFRSGPASDPSLVHFVSKVNISKLIQKFENSG